MGSKPTAEVDVLLFSQCLFRARHKGRRCVCMSSWGVESLDPDLGSRFLAADGRWRPLEMALVDCRLCVPCYSPIA